MPTAVCNASVESEPRSFRKCPSVYTVQQCAQCKVHVFCVQNQGCSGSMLYRKGHQRPIFISIWVWLNLWSQNTQKPVFTIDSFLWALYSGTQFHPGTIADRSRNQAPGLGRQLSEQKHLLLKHGDLSSNPQHPLKKVGRHCVWLSPHHCGAETEASQELAGQWETVSRHSLCQGWQRLPDVLPGVLFCPLHACCPWAHAQCWITTDI